MAVISAQRTEDHEFVFTVQDFERISALIHRHAGIALTPSKKEMVYSRLARRLRAKGIGTFNDYLALLEQGDPQEWEQFTNSLTTNLTAFFREPHHFPILAEHVRGRRGRPSTVWCCAASTGEEPYSIAMTMAEVFDTLMPPVRILATDLDTQVLAWAQAGVYELERVEKMPLPKIRRFFHKGTGANAGMVRVRAELQSMISFRQLNLLADNWPVRGPFDAIFCRNVMIYFDKPTQRAILQRFVPLLARDGLLFAGHSESFHHAVDLFRPCGRTVYALQRSTMHA